MSLLDKITADMKDAMRSQDKVKVSALRMLMSEINYVRKSSEEDLTDEQELSVLMTAAKKRKESIESYRIGERIDLLEKEQQELEILSAYLPEQLSEEDVSREIESVIAELGASSMKDFGRVMGESMKKLKGKADGTVVQELVRRILA